MMKSDMTSGDPPPALEYHSREEALPSKGHYSRAVGWCCVAMLWGWAMLPGGLLVSTLAFVSLFAVIPLVWGVQRVVSVLRLGPRRRVSVRSVVTTTAAVVVTLALGMLDVPLRLTVAISRPFVISAWENTPSYQRNSTFPFLGLFMVEEVRIDPGGVLLMPVGGNAIEYRYRRERFKVFVHDYDGPQPLIMLRQAYERIRWMVRRFLPRSLHPRPGNRGLLLRTTGF